MSDYIHRVVIIEALLLGVTDGQNILTLSLGGSAGWTEAATAVVASRIADTGIIVTIAAGAYTFIITLLSAS